MEIKTRSLGVLCIDFFYFLFLIVKEKQKTMSENIRNWNKFSCVAFLKYKALNHNIDVFQSI